MKPVFVDTSALVALGNKQDKWHDQALTMSRQLTLAGCRFITTEAVLLETGNTFSRACYKPVALRLATMVRHSPRWQCISVDSHLFESGLALFEKMSDKDWSLVDCISISVAYSQHIKQIFTTERL